MEQALFQKGAFGDDDTANISDDKKASPEEIENLLKFGAFAFLDNDDDEENNIKNMKIEDILASKGREKKPSKKGHQILKSSFNTEDKKGSGKVSKNKLDVNDKEFW